PFIWQYARKAGFRTMYIDAQAPEDKNTGRLQNYMTVEEVKWIDEFVVIQNTSSPTLDFKALEMVGEKLKGDTPYFIYVNKNGAHFPYDKTYPADAVRFRPTMSEADGGNTKAARINSYRNSVSWSVDGFLRKLFDIDLSHSAVFYTSDHGQQFDPRPPHALYRERSGSARGARPALADLGRSRSQVQVRRSCGNQLRSRQPLRHLSDRAPGHGVSARLRAGDVRRGLAVADQYPTSVHIGRGIRAIRRCQLEPC